MIYKEKWSAYPSIPDVIDIARVSKAKNPIWRRMTTKYEGDILYYKYWNFWVRAGVRADLRADRFFPDYERGNENTDNLLRDIGFPWKKADTEEEVWSRIGMVWKWLRDNVSVNNAEYATISSTGGWPSILDYAQYYAAHGNLVWAACFSKAHLFATLLGRMVYPRFRFAIASAHHTENGAPPTATHVYGAVYLKDRWFYLDPTFVNESFPNLGQMKSIGNFTTVDYEHPYMIIPVPLSGFELVPYLPK